MKNRTRFLVSPIAAAAALLAGAASAAPPAKTPELVAKGKASYEINCSSCHGARGAGDGVAAASLDPKPRNLATGPFRNGTEPAQVFATLAKGINGTGMISFGHLPEEERWALAYYVLDLRAGKKAAKK